MSDRPVLYGFDGSTYVRTVRALMAAKGIEYDQVPVNVLEGEPRQPAHLARHPFGKVPVVDVDGMRLLETQAICGYLDETRDGTALTPGNAKDRARMAMANCLTDSYGYGALVGAAGYHLFPDFIGNPSAEQHRESQEAAQRFLDLMMEKKGADPWLAGQELSLADLHLGPIMFYVGLTPEKDRLMGGAVGEWWDRLQGVDCFTSTAPDLG